MGTTNDEKKITFTSRDHNGRFEFRIIKGGIFQIQVETQIPDDEDGFPGDDLFIDVSYQELTGIRDVISLALKEWEVKNGN